MFREHTQNGRALSELSPTVAGTGSRAVRQAIRSQLTEELTGWMVSGLQVLMGTHWGQGTVAGAWLLQPFIWVVSRSLERSVYGSAG